MLNCPRPSVVTDLVRVTKPGGWIELVEPPLGFEQAGQATQRLFALWKDLAASLELRAPFPQGYVLEEGDWALLDPVRARPPSLRRA